MRIASDRGLRSRPARLALAPVVFALLLLALTLPAAAARAADDADDLLVPVIEAGREAEIMALVVPHAPEQDVVAGWKLAGAGVDRSTIRFVVEGPAGAEAALQLDHPSLAAADAERTESFALTREGPADAAPALDALAAAVRRNDAGNFWRATGRTDRRAPTVLERVAIDAWKVLRDDALHFALALVFFLLFLVRTLRGAPRHVPLVLAATVVVAAVLRAFVAEDVTMTAWGYGRHVPAASWAASSPLFAPLLTWLNGGPLPYTDLVSGTNLLLGAIAPAVLFVHARAFFRDDRAGLVAAVALALLPLHIRFGRSDVYFLQSIVLSSFAFTLLYAAGSERSRAWFVATLVTLCWVLYGVFVVRPLNVLFFPLFLYPVFFGDSDQVSLRRRLLLVAVLLASLGFVLVTRWLGDYAGDVGDALSLQVLADAATAFFSFDFNTFANPRMTPTGLTLLAIAGLVILWRTRSRLRALFLMAWFFGFFLAHAVVVPAVPEMQARYHLHIVVPFVLALAPAVLALSRWRRWTVAVVALYVTSAPLVHLPFLRDVDFDVMHEWRFLASVRDQIPRGCTVLEYDGLDPRPGLRFGRFGLEVGSTGLAERWTAVSVGREVLGPDDDVDDETDDETVGPSTRRTLRADIRPSLDPAHWTDGSDVLSDAARALVEAPPECLYVYEGLPCWGFKPPAYPIAPACAALREALPLEPVATTTFRHRPYDANNTVGLTPGTESLTLTLYRMTR